MKKVWRLEVLDINATDCPIMLHGPVAGSIKFGVESAGWQILSWMFDRMKDVERLNPDPNSLIMEVPGGTPDATTCQLMWDMYPTHGDGAPE